MIETPPIPVIPFTAWEQIVAVALFVVFVLFLLWMLLRYMFTHFSNIVSSLDVVIDKFLKASELQDQRFLLALDKREEAFDERNGVVREALIANSRLLGDLIVTFRAHDAKFDQALADMRTAKDRHSKKETPS